MGIDTSKIKLAELKYFDEKHNGVEFTEPQSLGILLFVKGRYVNLFEPGECYPVFKRNRFYGCFDGNGSQYGTKLEIASGEAITGPCWVLRDVDFKDVFGKSIVDYEDIENYVLGSDDFFKDRMKIALERLEKFRRPAKMMKIINRDMDKTIEMEEFFLDRGHKVQKVKKG